MSNPKLKKRIKEKLGYTLTAGSPAENYGFGRNWTLNITKDGTPVQSYWLGQDAKVTSRMLGIDFKDAVDYYSKKAKSKNFDKVSQFIARDIIRASIGEGRITQKKLRKMMGGESWALAVQ